MIRRTKQRAVEFNAHTAIGHRQGALFIDSLIVHYMESTCCNVLSVLVASHVTQTYIASNIHALDPQIEMRIQEPQPHHEHTAICKLENNAPLAYESMLVRCEHHMQRNRARMEMGNASQLLGR